MDDTFKKRTGTTDKGKNYEDLIVADFILKLITDDKLKDFKISSNDDQFGAFDDVVIKILLKNQDKKQYALQLKQVNKGKALTKNALTENRGNFSIKKYFENFQQLNNFSVSLVLFTNLKFNIPDGEIIHIQDENIIKIKILKGICQPLLNTASDGQCYKFEIPENVENSTKIQEYKKFFKNFFLYVNQANVDALKETITTKFQKMFCCDRVTFREYYDFIREWSIQEGVKIKLNKTMMKKAIAVRLLSTYIQPFIFSKDIKEKSIVFQEAIFRFKITLLKSTNCDKIRAIYGDSKKHFINLKEINKIGKQFQIISNYRSDVHDFSDEEVTKLLWLLGKCPLIVSANKTVFNTINFCDEDQRFIVLEDGNCHKSFSASEVFHNLSNLEFESEIYDNIIKTFTCSLQGKHEITLESLINIDDNIYENITTNELLQMVNGPLNIGREKETLPVPYIDRFLTNTVIHIKFLEKIDADTIIVISCFNTTVKIKKYLQNCNIVSLEEYLNNPEMFRNCNIFVNENYCTQNEIEEVSRRNPEKNCHHVKATDDVYLEWISSKDSIRDLYEYSDKYFIEETDFFNYDIDNRINVVCTGPGMGKTSLMKNLKNNCQPTYWSILMYPKEHTVYLLKKNPTPLDFINYILTTEKLNHFERKIVEIFRRKKRIIFIWDGLDEMSNDRLSLVLDIIDGISNNGFGQWIASRSNLRKTLEERFRVFSKDIIEFNDNQQHFYIEERIKNVSDDVKIKKIIQRYQEMDILRIPLQIFMFTELLRQNREKFSILFEDTFSITDLYHYFFEEKFYNYFRKNLEYFEGVIEEMIEQKKNERFKQYEEVALKTLFDKEILEILNITCEPFLLKIKHEGDSFGIITEVIDDDVPNFFHYSFGEYLAANYLVRNHSKIPQFQRIIFQEKYRNIRLMFDFIMAKNCPAHIAVLHKNIELLMNCKLEDFGRRDLGGRNLLHLACSWSEKYPLLQSKKSLASYHINEGQLKTNLIAEECHGYKKILDYLAKYYDPWDGDQLYGLDSFGYADQSLCLYPIMVLCNFYKINFSYFINYKDVPTVIYYSIRFGFPKVLDNFDTIPLIMIGSENLLYLTVHYNRHECLEHLLEYETYRNRVNDVDSDRNSVLHKACQNGSTEIVRLLMKCPIKSNVNHAGKYGLTPLRLACHGGYTEIVRVLIENKAQIADDLSFSIVCGDGYTEIVRLLLDSQLVYVNKLDYFGYSPLYKACVKKHMDIAQLLIDYKANVNFICPYGIPLLHWMCKKNLFLLLTYYSIMGSILMLLIKMVVQHYVKLVMHNILS